VSLQCEVTVKVVRCVASSLFGFQSGAALATVVGVLVKMTVMLSVVKIVISTKQ